MNSWTVFEQDGMQIESDGDSARFYRPFGNGNNVESTITRTVSTLGFNSISVGMAGTQVNTVWEADDFIELRYDLNDGNGFQTLFNGTGGLPGNSFNTGQMPLFSAAEQNSMLRFQIAAQFNAGSEGYNVDVFRVEGIGGAAGPPPAPPEVFFTDTFDADPGSNGWTESVQDGIAIDEDGGSGFARFYRPTGANGSNVEASITQTISTEGFENIVLEFFGDQVETNFEADDYIDLSVDFGDGNGFTSIYTATGNLPGRQFDSGFLPLLPGADDNPNFTIQISTNFNAGAEAYRINELNVIGSPIQSAAVPEPASFALWSLMALGLGMIGMLRRGVCRK